MNIIKSGLEIERKKIISFLEKIINKYAKMEYYDDEFYSMESILLNRDEFYSMESILLNGDFTKYYFVLRNNQIVDIIFSNMEYGVKVLYPHFVVGSNKEETIEALKEFFKEEKVVVFLDSYSYDIKKLGLYSCLFNSNIESEYKYYLGHGCYMVLNEENIFVLRNAIEDLYFPNANKELNMEDISFELVDDKDRSINLWLNDENPLWESSDNQLKIIGFHYLNIDFFENDKLLIAKYKGTIIGCIKYGIYYEGYKSCHYGLNYIDVKYGYRNKGIAKLLIKELAKILEDKPLFLSKESKMGKLCKMEKNFKETKFKVNVFTYDEKAIF